MKFNGATKVHRKSGMWGTRGLWQVVGLRGSAVERPAVSFAFLTLALQEVPEPVCLVFL
jgi:hypothetical protein